MERDEAIDLLHDFFRSTQGELSFIAWASDMVLHKRDELSKYKVGVSEKRLSELLFHQCHLDLFLSLSADATFDYAEDKFEKSIWRLIDRMRRQDTSIVQASAARAEEHALYNSMQSDEQDLRSWSGEMLVRRYALDLPMSDGEFNQLLFRHSNRKLHRSLARHKEFDPTTISTRELVREMLRIEAEFPKVPAPPAPQLVAQAQLPDEPVQNEEDDAQVATPPQSRNPSPVEAAKPESDSPPAFPSRSPTPPLPRSSKRDRRAPERLSHESSESPQHACSGKRRRTRERDAPSPPAAIKSNPHEHEDELLDGSKLVYDGAHRLVPWQAVMARWPLETKSTGEVTFHLWWPAIVLDAVKSKEERWYHTRNFSPTSYLCKSIPTGADWIWLESAEILPLEAISYKDPRQHWTNGFAWPGENKDIWRKGLRIAKDPKKLQLWAAKPTRIEELDFLKEDKAKPKR